MSVVRGDMIRKQRWVQADGAGLRAVAWSVCDHDLFRVTAACTWASCGSGTSSIRQRSARSGHGINDEELGKPQPRHNVENGPP